MLTNLREVYEKQFICDNSGYDDYSDDIAYQDGGYTEHDDYVYPDGDDNYSDSATYDDFGYDDAGK